jgi:hypothetical protein
MESAPKIMASALRLDGTDVWRGALEFLRRVASQSM